MFETVAYIINTHVLLDCVLCVSSVWLCLSALGSAVLVGGVSLQPIIPGMSPAGGRDRAPQRSGSPAWISRTPTLPLIPRPPIAVRSGELGHPTGVRASYRPAGSDTESVWHPSAQVFLQLQSLCSGCIV